MTSLAKTILKKIRNASAAVAVAFLALLPASVLAAGPDLGLSFATATGLTTTDIRTVIARIISYFLGLLGLIALLLILYAGFTWMTAGGNEEKVSQAKRILTQAVIGLVIIMSAFAITQFVVGAIEQGTQGGGGNNGCPTAGGCCPAGQVCGDLSGGGGFNVTGITPAGAGPNNEGWPKNYVFSINFNEKVAIASATSANVQVFKCNPRLVNGAASPFNYNSCNTPVAGTITPGGDGSRLDFQPSGTPGANPTDFEADFWYKISVQGQAVTSESGDKLQCPLFTSDISLPGAPSAYCARAAAFNDKRDTQPPTVTVGSPLSPPPYCASASSGSLAQVIATGNDDIMVAGIDYLLDGSNAGLTDVRGIALSGSVNGLGLLPFNSADVYADIGSLTPGMHKVSAVARDGVPQMSSTVESQFKVNPPHCCNNVLDGAQGETAKDCGGECGACVGGSCTTTADCSAGAVCVAGKCVTQPTITSINTYAAGPGTLITINGTGFGVARGTVTFLGGPGDGDDKIAQICAPDQGWADTQVVVAVPAGAANGPIKLGASTGFDATNDTNGPALPDFTINTSTAPGICYLDPSSGAAGTKFAINGAGFGAAASTSNFVQVGSTQATVVTCAGGEADCGWSDTRIWVTTPPIAEGDYPVTATVNSTLSNPSTYVIRSADPLARATVTGVIPESGPVGTYVTIQGLHFGTRKGVVKFLYGSGLTAEVAISDDPVCSDNWHDNYIIVKVPAKYKSTLVMNASASGIPHGIQVETSTPTQISNNNITFAVNTDPLRPGICSMTPDNGPAASNVTVHGEGFNGGGGTPSAPSGSSSPRFSLEFFKSTGKHCLYSPATACDALQLGQNCPTAGQGVCVPNTLPAPLYRSWSDTAIEGIVAGITTDKNTWPKTGPVYVIANNQLSANAVPFTVQDCNQAGAICGTGTQCCSNGSCQTSCVVAAKTSAYGWQFSTSVLPSLPYVIERAECDIDAKLFQSPSPAHDSQDACKNAQAYFEFSRKIDTTSVSNATVKVDKCGSGDVPDCSTVVSVPMMIGATSFTGCDAANPANCAGFQTQPSAAYNGGFWEKKAWYRVTLISNPATGVGLKETGPTGKFLDGDLDRKQGGDYVTMFRVRDSDEPCQIENVLVAASRQTIADDQNPIGFNANPIAANCNVLTCDDNQYDISWITVPTYLTTTISPALQPVSQCTRKVLAVKETPPGQTTAFTATMSAKPSGLPKSGQSDVTVKFAEPHVLTVSPTNGCTQACINAAITATFNVPMNAASLSGSNVEVKVCRNDTCAPPYLPLPNGFTYTSSLSPDGLKLTVNKSIDFAVSTSYIVSIKGDDPATPAVEGAMSLSGVPLSGLNDGQSYSWKFRTKNDPSRCAVASTTLQPKSARLLFVGDRAGLNAAGYGSADACNPEGQELDTTTTNWLWTFDTPNLVLQGFVHGDDFAGPYQFWRPEIKATQSTVVDTKPHPVLGCSSSCLYAGSQDEKPACGDSIVDAKYESCDLGASNGTGACNKNCTLRGNTAANGCGDGTVDAAKGEECDMISGVFPPGCKKPDVADPSGFFATNIGCIMTGASSVPGTQCGNGLIGDGEECDDGGLTGGDGCSSDCLFEGSAPSCATDPANPQCIGVCGNSKLEPGEDPDCEKNGVSPSSLNCSPHSCLKNGTSACATPNDVGCCGNGSADPGEDAACDTVSGIPAYCTTRCLLKGSSAFYDKPSFCGDGYKGAGEVASCEPSGNGDGNTDGYQATVANTQNGFDATSPTGSMSTVKASISGVSDAKSGRSQISLSCTCKNEPATAQDTFCSNLRADLACADNGCCMPRPTVERVEPTTFNSCRNALVTMVFSEPMNDTSLTKNFMVGFGNGSNPCPPGTVEVPTAYVHESFWVRLWHGMVNFVKDTFIRPVFGVSGNDAGYSTQTFCSVKGSVQTYVDGTGATKKTILTFSPSHAYPTDKYIRIRLNPGAKSAKGVPLSITDINGAGGYTAYFGTGSTICEVQKVTVTPESILLSSVEDQQIVSANAIAAGGQSIVPTPEYAWGWSWDTYPSAPVTTAAPLVITPRVTNLTSCGLGAKCVAAGGCPCYIDSGSALCSVSNGSDTCTGSITETLPLADLRVRGSKAADGAYSPKNSKGQLPINAKAVIANECSLPAVCTSPAGCQCGAGMSACTVINGAMSCAVLSGAGVSTISSQITTGTGSAVVMLCKHPWPIYHDCVGTSCYTDIWQPYAPTEFPGVAFYYCRDLEKTGATSMAAPGQPVADADGGTKPSKSSLLAGATTPATTLPCLKETPASVAAPVPGILREYLFTYESNLSKCPDGPQAAGAPWLNDAFGLRVSSNDQHANIGDWYFGRGFRGNPTPKLVDGNDALSEGRTTYVSAAFRKASSQKLYTNSYIISYSDGSAPETSTIFNQILLNIDFNADPELQNFGACRVGSSRTDAEVLCTTDNDCRVDSFGRAVPGREQYKCDSNHVICLTSTNIPAPDAGNPVSCASDNDCFVGTGGGTLTRPAAVTCDVPKAKLTRDVKRWSSLLALRGSLIAKSTETGSFPKLDAGTYLRAQTNSTWPSWNDVLAKGVGSTIPSDPLNVHAACATANAPYDPKTCWDANKRQYVCPAGSHVYEYQSFGGVDFWLRGDFEYNVLGDTWGGGTCLDKTDLASCVADPLCGGTCSNNKAQSCTDSGDCSGGTCNVPCNYRLGKVILGAGSSASCQGIPVSPTSGGSCGDRILQNGQADPAKNEVCEIGMTQSVSCDSNPTHSPIKQGARTETCNSLCSGWVPQGKCSTFSPRAGSTCTSAADCGTGGICISGTNFACNGVVGNANNNFPCTKDTDCTDPQGKTGVCTSACMGGRCGDGAVQTPEQCDDGALNGTYGHCKADCTAVGFSCGDSLRQPSEACDCGPANGQYAFNGIKASAPNTNSPNQCVVDATAANVTSCSWDCDEAGPRCGDGIINGTGDEKCDGGFEEYKGFCNDNAQTGCDTTSQCPAIGTCVTGTCSGGTGVACTSNSDCVGSCGHFCPTVEQKQRHSCNPNNPAATTDDKGAGAACTWSKWTCTSPGTCGNGKKETGEQCDDGNTDNGDSCVIDTSASYACKAAICGDGYVYPASGEECDTGSLNGRACIPKYGITCNFCNGNCRVATVSGAYCGDNQIQDGTTTPIGPEQCDGVKGLGNEWVCVSKKEENRSFGLLTGPGGCSNQSCQHACADQNSEPCNNTGSNSDSDLCTGVPGGPAGDWCNSRTALSAKAYASISNSPFITFQKSNTTPAGLNDSCDPDDDNDGVPDNVDCEPNDPAVHPTYQIQGHDGLASIVIPEPPPVCGKDAKCKGKVDNFVHVSGRVKNARYLNDGNNVPGSLACNPSHVSIDGQAMQPRYLPDAKFVVMCGASVVASGQTDSCGKYAVDVWSNDSCGNNFTLVGVTTPDICADLSDDAVVHFSLDPNTFCKNYAVPNDLILAPKPGGKYSPGQIMTMFITWGPTLDLDFHLLDSSNPMRQVGWRTPGSGTNPPDYNAIDTNNHAGDPCTYNPDGSLASCPFGAGPAVNRVVPELKFDTDDVYGPGPETMTFSKYLQNIDYVFFVENYDCTESNSHCDWGPGPIKAKMFDTNCTPKVAEMPKPYDSSKHWWYIWTLKNGNPAPKENFQINAAPAPNIGY